MSKTTLKSAGRPRLHESPAAKQAAYRSRLSETQPNLRSAALRLHDALNQAARSGDSEAGSVLGASAAETLSNLARRYGASASATS